MNKEEAAQVFDGLMLGDAGLEYNKGSCCFAIDLSAGDPTPWVGREREAPQFQYLEYIKECLEDLGIKFGSGTPRASVRTDRGKPFLCCHLWSLTSNFLKAQFKRWYRPVTPEIKEARGFLPNRKWYKILPSDVKLPPRTVSTWYEGDGGKARGWRGQRRVRIATNSFSFKEIVILCGLLSSSYGIQVRPSRHDREAERASWEIHINTIAGSNAFLGLIGGLVHPCYQYKVEEATLEEITEEEKKLLKEYRKRWYGEHREHARAYYEEHRDQILERTRAYYEEHRAQISEYKRSYYKEHKEQYRENQRSRRKVAQMALEKAQVAQNSQFFSTLRLGLQRGMQVNE